MAVERPSLQPDPSQPPKDLEYFRDIRIVQRGKPAVSHPPVDPEIIDALAGDPFPIDAPRPY